MRRRTACMRRRRCWSGCWNGHNPTRHDASMRTPAARLRAYGVGERIVGVDIARGLAVLGMFGAHVASQPEFDWGDPASWGDVVNGRSSILFAVLAGVSIAIISGSVRPYDGTRMVQARLRILVRAALIFGIGGILELLGTPIAVILPYYAVLFVLSLPFLRWPVTRLLFFAAAIALVTPCVVFLARESPPSIGFGLVRVLLDVFITGYCPCLVWMAFLLAGIALGRLDLAAI